MNQIEKLAAQNPVKVVSIGFDMRCRYVVTKSVLSYDNGKFILLNGGVKILCDDTSDLLLDTKENRTYLKSKCG